jgi:proline dehydrogenase
VQDPGQHSLVDLIPDQMVTILASPYLAGRTAADALVRAQQLYKECGFAATIDILGEEAGSDEDCDCSVENYRQLIDLLAANRLDTPDLLRQASVSFKPSMFSVCAPDSSSADKGKHLDRAYERMESIVKHAADRLIRITVEAEDHVWTDYFLDSYVSLIKSGYHNCGTVLQSRLFRTRNDLKLFDERMRVRMVTGIYNEPAQIALTQKPQMKKAAVEYASELLDRGVYVELASHDGECVRDFIENAVVPTRAPANKFEIQHLLGVPRKELQQALASGKYFETLSGRSDPAGGEHLSKLAAGGALVRMYLPFGQGKVAGPYCKRRLKANPDMIGFGIKNLLRIP